MIEIQNATKRFGSLAALEHLNLQIKPGCIYGLVGPNGSGKSTLLRLISGVYRADEGRVLLDGSPAWENPATKDKILYLADDLYIPPQKHHRGSAEILPHHVFGLFGYAVRPAEGGFPHRHHPAAEQLFQGNAAAGSAFGCPVVPPAVSAAGRSL